MMYYMVESVLCRVYCDDGTMPRVFKLSLSCIELGGESLGPRGARIRKERGFTQTIVSAIKRDRFSGAEGGV